LASPKDTAVPTGVAGAIAIVLVLGAEVAEVVFTWFGLAICDTSFAIMAVVSFTVDATFIVGV